jgi:hypothetical protein
MTNKNTRTLWLNNVVIGEILKSGDDAADAEAAEKFVKENGLSVKPLTPAQRVMHQALAFSMTANQLYSQRLMRQPPDPYAVAPFVVNIVFAIELYLKALGKLRGITLRGHKLVQLYEELPSDVRHKLDEVAQIGVMSARLPADTKFRDCLLPLNDAFVNWRYLFEDPNVGLLEFPPLILVVGTLERTWKQLNDMMIEECDGP